MNQEKFGVGALSDDEIISALKGNLVNYRTDIAERNTYIDSRDRYLYGDGLYENIVLPDGFDSTFYNYLRRITAIHAEQMMNHGFGVTSHYDTEDLSQIDVSDKNAMQAAVIRNKIRETKAVARQKAIQAMIRDNGHFRPFQDGAQTGADYGSTLYQMWWDQDKKKIRWELLESIQNWFPVWSDNNFRERLGDAYVYQIALETANTKYGKYSPREDYTFPVTYAGDPLINIQGSSSTMTNTQGETVSAASTRRPMVTVINYTGVIPYVKYGKNGDFEGCNTGEETPLSFKIIGDLIVEKITKEDYMPKFYYIPNERVPRRPYGEADIPNAAVEINSTILQLKSDQHTLVNKELFPMIQAKGFESGSVPKRKQREATIVFMQPEQELIPVPMPMQAITIYQEMINDRMKDLSIVTSTPLQMLLADTNGSSGPAAIEAQSPMINLIEKKQGKWGPELIKMFTDGLMLASKHDKNMAEIVDKTDGDWWIWIDWPSHLRKEDPAHQAMLINDLRAGVLSVGSYMRKRGDANPDQEIDLIRQDLSDKVRSAILGGKLAELAQFTIFEKLGIPLWGFNQPHITMAGIITPEQQGNMAQMYGWNDGPYGASIGAQGLEGNRANQNVINQGLDNFPPGSPPGGPYGKYGMPVGIVPGQPLPMNQPGAAAPAGGSNTPPMTSPAVNPGQGQQSAAPIVTPQQNQPGAQPMSMPGSGATTTSAVGAVKHHNQNAGH